MKKKHIKKLHELLQIAVEVELSTIPLYLYTYYSINRLPENLDNLSDDQKNKVTTFANKAGAVIMSVAVEEMLHLSLASNVLKALGGTPKIYGKSPEKYPTNLAQHQKGFSIGLEKLSKKQLKKFMDVEKPAEPDAKAEDKQWETLGQFYKYIEKLIYKYTTDEDFKNAEKQLGDGKGYYAPNNVDTIYPKDASDTSAKNAVYSNADDSGGLKQINSKKDAIDALQEICEQGEGNTYDSKHQFDDPSEEEETHWFKYKELHKEIKEFSSAELSLFTYNFPDNPTYKNFPRKYQLLIEVNNAVYSYLLWMTEKSFTLEGSAQSSMFYIGMHKGMIFILDKLIGGLRRLKNDNGDNLAPTFQNYIFQSESTAKQELIALAEYVNKLYPLVLSNDILQRIKDLPDVHVVDGTVSFADSFTIASSTSGDNGCGATPSKCPSQSGCGTKTSHSSSNNSCGATAAKCPSQSGCGTKASHSSSNNSCGATASKSTNESGCGTKTTHTTSNNGCSSTPTPKNSCDNSGSSSKPKPPAVIDNPKELHVCMGLNSCKGHDRTGKNDCAGTGQCATATMHSCHTLNDCRNQGGCGLYGTGEEQNNPGNNDCAWQGSCGVPINAERFSTEGPNKNKSVWKRARKVFEEKMEKANRQYGDSPMEDGPTADYIRKNFTGYAACGASGLSGGGTCS